MRINKYLAECGIASRRESDNLIKQGLVLVNGRACSLGQEIDEYSDTVVVDGKKISKNTKKYEYYILNKPKGYICAVKDDKGRKTVMDLLPKTSSRLYPVGRLDYATEGLLIITNDGDLTYRLTHPKNEVPKTYLVRIEGSVNEHDLAILRNGVIIDGKRTNKCSVRIVDEDKEHTKLSVTITEGRNRQVRRMFESINKNVDFLKRIKIGDLTLRGLNRGEARKLSLEEINYLKNI